MEELIKRHREGTDRAQRRVLVGVSLAVAGALLVILVPNWASDRSTAAAAASEPNILVIETDDQTVESMKVMQNVNSLIGAQGATFANSFVNYSLCCPSRSTFLTGQYAHNHRVLSNSGPEGGFQRFESLHATNNLAVWLRHAGYYTAMVGKYLNGYANKPPKPPGWSEWHAVRSRRPAGLRLHDQQRRRPGDQRSRRCGLQAGLPDRQGRQLHRSTCIEAAAVLSLAHVYGAAHRAGVLPATPFGLRSRAATCAQIRACLRFRTCCRCRRTSTRPTSRTNRRPSEPSPCSTTHRSLTSGASIAVSWSRCSRSTTGSGRS